MEKYTSQEVITLLKNKLKPKIKNQYDALFILLHAIMESAGFKLVALGDSDVLIENKELPEEWNQNADAWAFRYRHGKSSFTFHLKALRLGSQLLVHAIAVEQNEILNLNLETGEYVNTYAPLEDYDQLFKNVDKLIEIFDKAVLRKLMPTTADIREAAEAARNLQQQNQQQQQQQQSQPDRDILRVPRPDTGGSGLRVPRPQGSYPQGNYPPFGIGGDDLYPGPGGGFGYIPGVPGGDPFHQPGYGGSQIGPNHPGFGIRDPFAPPNAGGGFGGFPGVRPPPRGARFDPFGPPGTRPNPDNDHFPPPGGDFSDDMYM
jgi:hypothetical protein